MLKIFEERQSGFQQLLLRLQGHGSYLVKSNNGIVLRRHVDQLRSCYSVRVEDSQLNDADDWPLSRLNEPPSPPLTPAVPTVQEPLCLTPPICQSQQSHRQIDFGPYVTS